MDDSGHRENGRHRAEQYKAAQSQWILQHHQPSMKQIMAIMAERDAAIQERNLALAEKKQAQAERDMAYVHRDAAIGERNTALLERDNAHATLQYRDNSLNTGNNMQQCPPGCQIAPGVKHMHQTQQHGPGAQQHPPQLTVAVPLYNTKDNDISETLPVSPDASEAAKSRKGKRPKEPKAVTSTKKAQKPPKKAKRESEDELNKSMFGKSHEWMGGGQDTSGGGVSKSNWKSQDLGLNQVCYDESTMPAPVCSCTGTLRQCYKWGNGGWQSSCCTTILSMYPLPAVPNKRHGRVGGRKMSGSAFNKLLSRLASEGHDLSNPVDLNNRWAKHGTNRYITIK